LDDETRAALDAEVDDSPFSSVFAAGIFDVRSVVVEVVMSLTKLDSPFTRLWWGRRVVSERELVLLRVLRLALLCRRDTLW
jgi:hypothetical protein